MQSTVLKVPLSKNLKESAEQAALNYGFSSLQEVLKKFMKKLAKRQFDVYSLNKEEEVVYLSKKAEKRYAKAMEDLKNGKNIYTAENVDDFLDQISNL